MSTSEWSLQDARRRFSAVVAAAERGEPQFLIKRGRAAVVVLSAADYHKLCENTGSTKPSFVEHILSAPKRPPEISDDEELFPREPFREREFDFDPER